MTAQPARSGILAGGLINESRVIPGVLPEKIRQRRLEAGLRQINAAKLMNTSKDTVKNWENDRPRPVGKNLIVITEFPRTGNLISVDEGGED